jgi:hypothetical protein
MRRPAECGRTGRVFQQEIETYLRSKSAFKCVHIQNDVNVPRNRNAVNNLFLPPVIRNITGAIDTSVITELFWRLNKPPATDWLRIGYLREKALLLRDEAGEFSFYKGNKSCRNTHHGKQIT